MQLKKKKYLPQLLFLIIIYVLLFVWLGTNGYLQSNDNAEHLKMAQNQNYTQNYHSWYRLISQFFTTNTILWFLFPAIITIGLTSYALYKISGIYSVWTLFSSSYFFAIIGAGLYAQALITSLILLFFVSKKTWVKIILLILIFFAHSTGWIFTGLLVITLFYNQTKLILFCSPIFGKNTPLSLEKNIGLLPDTANWSLSYKGILSFLVKGIPVPFIYFGWKGLIENKEVLFLFFIVMGFVGAFIANARVLLFVIPFVCIGFGQYYPKLIHKRLFQVFMGLMILYQWFNFLLLKWMC